MPRSASTSKRNVSSGRGRFQPQPMESELERTPVLFRLPEVDIAPAELDSRLEQEIQPTEEYPDEYETPHEEFLPEEFQSEIASPPTRRSQIDLPAAEAVEASFKKVMLPGFKLSLRPKATLPPPKIRLEAGGNIGPVG